VTLHLAARLLCAVASGVFTGQVAWMLTGAAKGGRR
jgi:hypothetical protein